MKYSIFILLNCSFVLFGQGGNDDFSLRGPQNTPVFGVVDGVVVKDELPVRSKIEYEHVRLADYVWSKRLFSRIDSKEKVNHPLFYPFDSFTKDFTMNPPKNVSELMTHKGWIRNQERVSLWTIILQGLMVGDLSMFTVCDSLDFNFSKEDGYALKYRVEKYNQNTDRLSYFSNTNPFYKRELVKGYLNNQERIGVFMPGTEWVGLFKGDDKYQYQTDYKNFANFSDWCNNIESQDFDALSIGQAFVKDIVIQKADPNFEKAWNKAMTEAKSKGSDVTLMSEDQLFFLSSDLITAYNIKEDWFFDKERSMLDKRIIAIAPVAKHTINNEKLSKRGSLIAKNPYTNQLGYAGPDGKPVPLQEGTPTAEYELFWLYFPELRNVMVNYYVYNNQSDAQWMSFDDFFWKRMFSATIYRASDQFDREIEDYRYGVDALYEAEKIKETMRTWETDLWNY